MTAQQPQHQLSPLRLKLFLAVTGSLLGSTQAVSAATMSTAFVAMDQATLRRERHSNVRLFSRCHETHLHAATLSYALPDLTATTSTPCSNTIIRDPFDPDFRPFVNGFDDLWGPSPTRPPLPVISTDEFATTTTLRRANDQSIRRQQRYHIHCDLDGVLVDFEAGVRKICKRSTNELDKTTMWNLIAKKSPNFFANLPWMPGGQQLWNEIKKLNPTILTGVPDLEGSCQDKFHWCRKNLGMNGEYRHVDMARKYYRHASCNGVTKACRKTEAHVTNIITCWSFNKHYESGRHAVLIDDRISLREAWEAKGGIFVHHTNTESTLHKLRELGVL